MLMQQDVESIGAYGFTNPILIAYGVVQLLGGILLVQVVCLKDLYISMILLQIF
jgi:hypothetical protein